MNDEGQERHQEGGADVCRPETGSVTTRKQDFLSSKEVCRIGKLCQGQPLKSANSSPAESDSPRN